MKEQEFKENLKEMGYEQGIEIPDIPYSLDDEGNVLFDEEDLRGQFEERIRDIKECLEEKKSFVIPIHARTEEQALQMLSPEYCCDNIMTEEEYKGVEE